RHERQVHQRPSRDLAGPLSLDDVVDVRAIVRAELRHRLGAQIVELAADPLDLVAREHDRPCAVVGACVPEPDAAAERSEKSEHAVVRGGGCQMSMSTSPPGALMQSWMG